MKGISSNSAHASPFVLLSAELKQSLDERAYVGDRSGRL